MQEGSRTGQGKVRCVLGEVVWILYVDGISMCLCIDLRGYVRILGAPSART